MNTKQKAEELVYFYENLLTPLSEKKDDFFFSRCKKCALITVDEIISTYTNKDKTYWLLTEEVSYWQEVKQELLNMK